MTGLGRPMLSKDQLLWVFLAKRLNHSSLIELRRSGNILRHAYGVCGPLFPLEITLRKESLTLDLI